MKRRSYSADIFDTRTGRLAYHHEYFEMDHNDGRELAIDHARICASHEAGLPLKYADVKLKFLGWVEEGAYQRAQQKLAKTARADHACGGDPKCKTHRDGYNIGSGKECHHAY